MIINNMLPNVQGNLSFGQLAALCNNYQNLQWQTFLNTENNDISITNGAHTGTTYFPENLNFYFDFNYLTNGEIVGRKFHALLTPNYDPNTHNVYQILSIKQLDTTYTISITKRTG